MRKGDLCLYWDSVEGVYKQGRYLNKKDGNRLIATELIEVNNIIKYDSRLVGTPYSSIEEKEENEFHFGDRIYPTKNSTIYIPDDRAIIYVGKDDNANIICIILDQKVINSAIMFNESEHIASIACDTVKLKMINFTKKKPEKTIDNCSEDK